MKLQADRLILRELQKSDAKSLAENANNLDVLQWMLVIPYPYTLKDANWFINKCMKDAKKKDREGYDFGIQIKGEKGIIGVIGMNKIDKFQGTATVGYWLGAKHHGKGYGTEALKALIEFSFYKLKLRRLNAGVFAGNPASGKLLTKVGFKLEGVSRKAARGKADGKIYDEEMYGLLKEDWKR